MLIPWMFLFFQTAIKKSTLLLIRYSNYYILSATEGPGREVGGKYELAPPPLESCIATILYLPKCWFYEK